MAPKKTSAPAGDAQGTEKKRQKTSGKAGRKEKTQPYEDESRKRDEAKGAQFDPATTEDEWINIIAVYLASEPKFIDFMKNPQPFEHITFNAVWLASVYLPARYKRYNSWEAWYQYWFVANKNAVLDRAADLLSDVHGQGQQRIDNTLAPLPQNSDADQDWREALFKVHSTRQKLLNTAKEITDTQHGLSKRLVANINGDTHPKLKAEMDELINELADLDTLKESIRTVLAKSKLNETGIEILDEMLQLTPADETCGTLYSLQKKKQEEFPVFDQEAEHDAAASEEEYHGIWGDSYAQIAAQNRVYSGVRIDFLCGRTLNMIEKYDSIFSIRSVKLPKFEKVQTTRPIVGDAFVDGPGLMRLDEECANWLREQARSFDQRRFSLNFRDFERQIERSDDCLMTKRDDFFWGGRHNRLVISRDNIVHVRRLVTELINSDMICDWEDEQVAERLQITLRRMYALLALMYGCVAEGGLLLTIMDRLLEDLASLVIGHVDPKMETGRMHKMAVQLNKKPHNVKRQLSINDYKVKEREHKARTVFAEIARFYRGAVIMLYGAASYRKSNENELETEVWYKGLVNYLSQCGHTRCAEQLIVKRIHKDGGRTNKWTISIAVKDGRFGFPEERSTVSKNRRYAYGCLYDFVAFTRYHAGLVPFLHYFIHLWHPSCRPFRGKSSLMADMMVLSNEGEFGQP